MRHTLASKDINTRHSVPVPAINKNCQHRYCIDLLHVTSQL